MTDSEKKKASEQIKEKASELGFDLTGITSTRILKENAEILKDWCNAGMNAEMYYLANNIEKRSNPDLLFPGTRSVIVTGLNYYTDRKQGGNGIPLFSRYAYGSDYHPIILQKLNALIGHIQEICPGTHSKAYVDSAPIFEKAWAVNAGLGWQGKNSLLLNMNAGSFFFIGIILTDVELENDDPFKEDHCGNCRLCIEACPTGAINSNRTIDARKCISYITVERRTPVTNDEAEKFEDRVFGCDKCQEVCKWNKKATQHNHPELNISDKLRSASASDLLNLTKEDYKRLFLNSSVLRQKYEIFVENVARITKTEL
ncbi:MAG TPA: tRNA epoxyqueuosine(34) reductase QueG [Bacteroidales bacterium]|nr:tRNA epoxyqueuosine(34) reductase QueG [Bacteroidales bacterium]